MTHFVSGSSHWQTLGISAIVGLGKSKICIEKASRLETLEGVDAAILKQNIYSEKLFYS